MSKLKKTVRYQIDKVEKIENKRVKAIIWIVILLILLIIGGWFLINDYILKERFVQEQNMNIEDSFRFSEYKQQIRDAIIVGSEPPIPPEE